MNCANHPEREKIAFCQNCGKPLCQECTRTVGSAVFCEPCLIARLASSGAPPPAGTPYPYGSAPGEAGYAPGAMPLNTPSQTNPGLAALLGFIPGVGAMYNGQYAKGVVHLIVFAILVSLSSENGIFGLFIAGWVLYQVFEAYQTALARREGAPLPNPFGLNDLGERLGFGKAWPSGTPVPPSNPASQPDPTAPPAAAYAPPYTPPASAAPPAGGAWSTPASSWDWQNHAAPPFSPAPPPYGAAPYPPDPALVPSSSRFPSGALWLIGLGCLFLIGNAGLFRGFPVHHLAPFFVIGFGVWLFVHKMTDTGGSLADDGSPAYRMRLFSALRGSIWIMLIGILMLLDTFGILSWGHSWPLIIIAFGVMAIIRRVSYAVPVYPYAAAGGYGVPPQPPAPPAAPGTSIVPADSHDQEGS